MKPSKIITSCYLGSQGVELPYGRLRCVLWNQQLPFANRVHDFYPRDRTSRRPKGLEPQHRTCKPLYGSMILLYEIIQIFGVADNNGCLMSLVVMRNRRRVGSTLIDGDFLWESL